MSQTHGLTRYVISLTIAAYILFSGFDASSRWLMIIHHLPPAAVLAVTATIAIFPFLALMVWEKCWLHPLSRSEWRLLIIRTLLVLAQLRLVFEALRLLPLPLCYALFFTTGIWTVFLSWIWLNERLTKQQVIAVLVSFTGVLIALYEPAGSSRELSLTGVACGLAASLLAAGAVTIARKSANGNRRGGALMLFTGMAALAIYNTAALDQTVTYTPEVLTICIIAGLSLGFGHLLFLHALRRCQAGLLAPFQYSQIIWAVILALVMFGESPRPQTLLGTAAIIAGGWWLVKKPKVSAGT